MYINIGIIGTPLSHTLSPMIHNYFFHNTCINGGYTVFDIKDASNLENVLEFLREHHFVGVNVTHPYKEKVYELCDSYCDFAEYSKAVNLIKFTDKDMKGYNTDIYGIDKLFELNNIKVDNSSILILGAGGASRALVTALNKFTNVDIFISNRSVEKAEAVANLSTHNITVMPYEKLSTVDCDIIINTTSIGDGGYDFLNIGMGIRHYAIDLQYTSGMTPFLDFMRLRYKHLQLVNGIDMLIMQAHKSFNIWTGREFEFDIKYFKINMLKL